jgi:hypothetical protein
LRSFWSFGSNPREPEGSIVVDPLIHSRKNKNKKGHGIGIEYVLDVRVL